MTNPRAPRQQWDKYAYRVLAATAVAILLLGTVVYHYLEDWSWVDSFYFASVAGTTVGFGDLAPSTDASKIFTVLYIFSAIGVLGGFLTERSRRRTDRRIARRMSEDER